MLVAVFYRRPAESDRFANPTPSAALRADYAYVCDVPVLDGAQVPEEDVFREMNAVDGTETCCQLRLRSMSVGDVLVISDKQVLYCASCGFEPVPDPAADEFRAAAEASDFDSV